MSRRYSEGLEDHQKGLIGLVNKLTYKRSSAFRRPTRGLEDI